MGRPGEMWGGRDRRGEAWIDVGRVWTRRRWCVEVIDGLCKVWH